MLNFTVGPVMMSEEVRQRGAEQIPYFRTEEFSRIMLENEELILRFANAPAEARAVFITGSGTASMEAALINTLSPKERVLVVDGGSFGYRFVQLCEIHGIPFDPIELNFGKALTEEKLEKFDGQGYKAFLVNMLETSTGVLYNMKLISDFCKRNNLFLIVDAISSFIADEFDMAALGVDVMITGSQKALACPPGVSIIVLSEHAIEKVWKCEPRCMYLDLQSALENGAWGQTPFTPAVGTLLQINTRLKAIAAQGGLERERGRIAALAADFRQRLGLTKLPLHIASESLSNAVTPLATKNCSAYDIFLTLKDKYGIWVCPNVGAFQKAVFRVGHIGDLSLGDNATLVDALKNLHRQGILK